MQTEFYRAVFPHGPEPTYTFFLENCTGRGNNFVVTTYSCFLALLESSFHFLKSTCLLQPQEACKGAFFPGCSVLDTYMCSTHTTYTRSTDLYIRHRQIHAHTHAVVRPVTSHSSPDLSSSPTILFLYYNRLNVYVSQNQNIKP